MRDQLNKGEHLSTPLKTKKHSFFQGGETKRMKTRKIMASLLAFAMLLSLVAVPVGTADAASNNSVNRVAQVGSDHEFTVAADAVKLRIEEKNAGEFDKAEAILKLKLNNAEFLFDDNFDEATQTGATNPDIRQTVTDLAYVKEVTKESDTEIRVVLEHGAADKMKWEIPLISKVTGDGEVSVVVEGVDNFISTGTLVYAISASGGSIAKVGSVKKFSDPELTDVSITIDETRLDSLIGDDQTIKLRLPNNFEWVGTPTIKWNGNPVVKTNVAATAAVPAEQYRDIDSDGERTLTIEELNLATTAGHRGTLTISGLTIKALSDAKFGEVSVRISGGKLSSQDLVVAEYRDYGVIIEVKDAKKDLPELYSGRWAGDYDTTTGKAVFNKANDVTAEEHELKELVIKENSEGAWLANRRTRIEFPSGVKVIGIEASDVKNFGTTTASDFENVTLGKNFVEYSALTKAASGKAEVALQFYVSVAADFEGDIVATVSGNALGNEKTEVVLGKAVKPATVEAGSVDLRIGVLSQAIGDIVITETEAGAIVQKDNNGTKVIEVKLARTNDGITWNKKPTVEVVSGDLEIETKDIKTSGNVLTIPVKSDSSKASQIKISGGTVDLNRNVPEGVFKVSIGGNALVQNNSDESAKQESGAHNVSNAASFEALNVVTPAPGEERRTVKFNLDSKEYVVIEAGKEVTKTMDVAPYNENGRALLPLRFVAEALGVSEDNIVWNANTKEVTIFKGDRVAKVAIGSNVLVVNGTNVVMDTTAAIKDSRTVLPIRFVGQALGANIGWDEATRTITVQQ